MIITIIMKMMMMVMVMKVMMMMMMMMVMMMMTTTMMMMMMMMILTLKDRNRDFYNLLTAPQNVSSMQSCGLAIMYTSRAARTALIAFSISHSACCKGTYAHLSWWMTASLA